METLRKIVDNKIEMFSVETNVEYLENLKKYRIIKEILSDDACFFKMSFNDAYSILYELGIDDPIGVYKKNVGYNEFIKQRENFEI